MNLLRIGRLTAEPGFEERVAQIGKAFAGNIARYPAAHVHLVSVLNMALNSSAEVIVTGDPAKEETLLMLSALRKAYCPNMVAVFIPSTGGHPDPRGAGNRLRLQGLYLPAPYNASGRDARDDQGRGDRAAVRERDQEPGVIRHGLKAMVIFLYLAMMMPGIAGSCLADNRPRPDNVPSDQVTAPGTSTPSTGTSSILMEEFHDLSAW
jgi:hypothetical protein